MVPALTISSDSKVFIAGLKKKDLLILFQANIRTLLFLHMIIIELLNMILHYTAFIVPSIDLLCFFCLFFFVIEMWLLWCVV